MNNLLCLVLLASIATSCDRPIVDVRYPIKVANNSTADILAVPSVTYPDTTIPRIAPDYCIISPTTECELLEFDEHWDEAFNKEVPGGKLQFFIFPADSFVRYNYDTLIRRGLLLKRMEITLEDLKRAEYKVIYE